MAGGHHHHGAAGLGQSAGERHRPRLILVLAMVATFAGIELVAALTTGSLALLSDAGHMFTDVVALAMALAAITAAARARVRPQAQRSFGLYRLEILAALANAGLLLAVAGYVLFEAVGRFREPQAVAPAPMLAVGAAGLAVTVTAFVLLRRGAAESLNVRGAALEVAFDALSSAGVVVAAVILLLTGWPYADPLIAAGIGVAIVPRALGLARQALRVLLQAAPAHIPVAELRADLAAIEGVVDAHDVHVWTLTSGMEVATAHLMTRTDADAHAVLDQARELLMERYRVEHATLQVEPETHRGCQEVVW